MLTTNCPLSGTLGAVSESVCPQDMGQIVKVAFQLKQTPKSFTAATIKLLATWTPLLAANDASKIVISPVLNDFKISKSEILTEGGNDNTTVNGMPQINGLGPAKATALLKSIQDACKQALQALFPYSQIQPGITNLIGWFINSQNQIISGADGAGFDIFGLAIGDPGTEGYAKHDESDFQFSLKPGWSDGRIIQAATDFDYLKLKNPA